MKHTVHFKHMKIFQKHLQSALYKCNCIPVGFGFSVPSGVGASSSDSSSASMAVYEKK